MTSVIKIKNPPLPGEGDLVLGWLGRRPIVGRIETVENGIARILLDDAPAVRLPLRNLQAVDPPQLHAVTEAESLEDRIKHPRDPLGQWRDKGSEGPLRSGHFDRGSLPKARSLHDVRRLHDRVLFPEEKHATPWPGESPYHDAVRARFVRGGDPSDKLRAGVDISADEGEMLRAYASSSTGLNRALRAGDKLSGKYKKMDAALSAAMERSRLKEPMTVYRQLPASAIVDGRYEEKGYMSTSFREGSARAYDPRRSEQSGLVTIRIELPKGTPYLMGAPSEVILPKGTTLVVKDGVARPELAEAESLKDRLEHPRDRLGRWIEKLGIPAYRVGGAVRDPLLGKEPKDVDFMLMAAPEEIKKAVVENGGRADDLMVRDRLVGVRAHVPDVTPPEGVELAPPRVERSTGPGRHDFEIVPHPVVMPGFFDEKAWKRVVPGEYEHPSGWSISRLDYGYGEEWSARNESTGVAHDPVPTLQRAKDSVADAVWSDATPIRDDALRRDFTVNAMYRDERTGELADPLGGAKDAEARILRTTSPDSFREDPLRILRGIRFISQHGLKLEPGTERQMRENAKHVTALTRKGVSGTARTELDKILMGEHVGDALRVMRDTGVMAEFLPELAPSIGYDQESRYHDLKLDDHIISVVENAAALGAPLEVRLAALFHDSGKPGTAWRGTDGKLHYYALDTDPESLVNPNAKMAEKVGIYGGEIDHETLGADIGRDALRRLGYPTATVDRVGRLIQEHMLPVANTKKDAKIRKWVAAVGPDLVDDVILHRRADFMGKAGGADPEHLANLDRFKARIEASSGPTSIADLAIGGKDLLDLGMKPGPEVGRVLRALFDFTITDPNLNNREWLLDQARKMTGLTEAASSAAVATVKGEVASGAFERLHPRTKGKFRQKVSPLGYSLKPTPDADKLIRKAQGLTGEHHPDLPEHLRGVPGKTIGGATLPPKMKIVRDAKKSTALGFGPGYVVFEPEEGERGGMVAVGVDRKGRVKREYSATYKEGQALAKHRRVTELARRLPEATERMKADAETDDSAAAVLLMRATGLRPGSKRDNKADVQAYGATTLLTNHVKIDDAGVSLQFVGKGGKLLRIPVADSDVADMLRRRVEAKGGTPDLLTRGEPLFETDERRAGEYLKTVVGPEFKVKDLRTALATAMAYDAVKRIETPPETKREASKLRKQIATEVSGQLGNTPNEALRAYINPDVWHGWPE